MGVVIRELIVAAAEGAGGGLSALRAADLPVRLEDFEVELLYADRDGAALPTGVSANIRFSFGIGEPGSRALGE